MKGALLLIIAAATLYVAGIYRVSEGMFVALAEIFVFCAMFLVSRFLRRQVDGTVLPAQSGMRRGETLPCKLQVSNRGRLPVWFWTARVVWEQDGKKSRRNLAGLVRGRGQEQSDFEISAEHCGFVNLTLQRLHVWDYMKLFGPRVRGKRMSRQVPVFPRRYVLHVESASGESMQALGTNLTPLPLAGTDVREVQQYREYQEGDSVKNIHWKLSARSEELWVKEFSRSDERRVELFLDLIERNACSAEEMDAFYEVFLALLLGLLEKYDSVYLYWYCWQEKALIVQRVTGEEQYQETLAKLYRTDRIPADQVDEKAYWDEKNVQVGSSLQLDLKLRLSYGSVRPTLLKQFSLLNYREEIEGQKVVIP